MIRPGSGSLDKIHLSLETAALQSSDRVSTSGCYQDVALNRLASIRKTSVLASGAVAAECGCVVGLSALRR